MSQELKPCPFCGAGQTMIHVNKGTWNGSSYGEPVSVEVRHWCEETFGQPARMISRVGRDEASAIAAWNKRAQPAGEAEIMAASISMSRHSRAMLLNVLWHHQGGSSPVGQPIRALLGIGKHQRLNEEQLAEAKWIDGKLYAAPPAAANQAGIPEDAYEIFLRAYHLGKPLDEAFSQGLRAALSKTEIPNGWKLAPIEPTYTMKDAPKKDRPGFSRVVATEVWRAMLAAAPHTESHALGGDGEIGRNDE